MLPRFSFSLTSLTFYVQAMSEPLSREWKQIFKHVVDEKYRLPVSKRFMTLLNQKASHGRTALAKKAWDAVQQITEGMCKPEEELAVLAGAMEELEAFIGSVEEFPSDADEAFDTIADWCNDGQEKFTKVKDAVLRMEECESKTAAVGLAKATLEWMAPPVEEACKRADVLAVLGSLSDPTVERASIDMDANNDLSWISRAAGIGGAMSETVFRDAPPPKYQGLNTVSAWSKAANNVLELMAEDFADVKATFMKWCAAVDEWPVEATTSTASTGAMVFAAGTAYTDLLERIRNVKIGEVMGRFVEDVLESTQCSADFVNSANERRMMYGPSTTTKLEKYKCGVNIDDMCKQISSGVQPPLLSLAQLVGKVQTFFPTEFSDAEGSAARVVQIQNLKGVFEDMWKGLVAKCSTAEALKYVAKYKELVKCCESWDFTPFPFVFKEADEEVSRDNTCIDACRKTLSLASRQLSEILPVLKCFPDKESEANALMAEFAAKKEQISTLPILNAIILIASILVKQASTEGVASLKRRVRFCEATLGLPQKALPGQLSKKLTSTCGRTSLTRRAHRVRRLLRQQQQKVRGRKPSANACGERKPSSCDGGQDLVPRCGSCP